MRRILYLEPVGGIAGDMFLAAAADLGVSLEEVARHLAGLRVPGWRFVTSRAERHALSGTHLDVVLDEAEVHPHRGLADIRALIQGADSLTPGMKAKALAVFAAIGEAEAKVHGVPVEAIHFHEVGAVDSIVDVCGAAVVLELLGDPEVVCAPPPLGSGSIRVAHGNMPIPVPATLELLREVPVRFEGVGELTTPTGAALVKVLTRVGRPPDFIVERVGYGVGTKDFRDRPNVLRASLGRATETAASLHVLEANLDDAPPQLLGHLVERLLAGGRAGRLGGAGGDEEGTSGARALLPGPRREQARAHHPPLQRVHHPGGAQPRGAARGPGARLPRGRHALRPGAGEAGAARGAGGECLAGVRGVPRPRRACRAFPSRRSGAPRWPRFRIAGEPTPR